MADVKISALPAGSQAAGGDVPMVQGGITVKVTLDSMAYQAGSAVNITGGTITGISNLTIANAGTLTPASNDGAALGTTVLSWADLFLATGGVINWNAGDVTITHAANTLTFAGATTTGYQFQDGPIRPVANDGIALGVSGTAFADLFLANGGVINWNAGDVTITHSAANALSFAGATLGYFFSDGPILPLTNDGAALGTGALKWSDLFLASGGVVNWNNGDVTVTHAANTLTFAGATTGYAFNDGPVRILSTSVGSLPSAATAGAGAIAYVTDALTPAFTAVVVGGGAVPTPVYSDGTDWRCG